jgi:hypothetical protein
MFKGDIESSTKINATRKRSVCGPNRKELYPFAHYKVNYNKKPLSVQSRSNTIKNLMHLYHKNDVYETEEIKDPKPNFKTDFHQNRRKVSFKDKKIFNALVDVEDVECYKNYNLSNTHKVGSSSTSLSCCMIF